MKIEKGYTKLTVPHKDKEITFAYPAFKGTYTNVAEAIKKEGLILSTSGQTASLVYDASQNKEGKYESEIIKILKDNWLWEFTGNLYLPKSDDEVNNGVILEDNPMIQNGKLIMDKNSLVKRLQENDPSVRFVPFGYKTGEQSSRNLEKNLYIIARYGEEGAQKIAEVADSYKSNPRLWSFDSVDSEKISLSALFGDWYVGRGLNVGVGDWNGGSSGHSFGVRAERRE